VSDNVVNISGISGVRISGVPLHRLRALMLAYVVALDGRDPEEVDILELLPTIHADVPDTSNEEIVAALRWAAAQGRVAE
jgi:hypothetical protein